MTTASPSKKFLIYRSCLKLYPKHFRTYYEQQMIVTMQDLLADSPSHHASNAVWLRAFAEMPLSILEANITNLGDKTMDKIVKLSNKRLRLIFKIAAGLVILLVLYFLKYKIVNATYNLTEGKQLTNTVVSQSKTIGSSALTMGGQVAKAQSCVTSHPEFLTLQELCEANYNANIKLGQSASAKDVAINAADAIDKSLAAEGYQAGSNGVTLSSLVAGAYEGKDYTPDTYYIKNVGNTNCAFDAVIAYANPQQPAISLELTCSKNITIVGKTLSKF